MTTQVQQVAKVENSLALHFYTQQMGVICERAYEVLEVSVSLFEQPLIVHISSLPLKVKEIKQRVQ